MRRLWEQPWWIRVLAIVGAIYLVSTAISLLVFLLVVLFAE
jgi:hypothetical protein